MSYVWIGAIVILLIMIGIIITIVVLNRQNTSVDLILSLPTYRIQHVEYGTYLGLTNWYEVSSADPAGNYYIIDGLQYLPFISLSPNPDFGEWSFLPVTMGTTSPVYFINQPYADLALNAGYVAGIAGSSINNSNGYLTPIEPQAAATIFQYIPTTLNRFQLKAVIDGVTYSVAIAGSFTTLSYTNDPNVKPAEFQLVPLNVN